MFPYSSRGVAAAQHLGEIAYQWRNYTAVGAIGPDISFCFQTSKAPPEMSYSTLLSGFVKYGSGSTKTSWKSGRSGLNLQLPVLEIVESNQRASTEELGQALQELAGAIMNAIIDLITKLWDCSGLPTSGVPQGPKRTLFLV